MRGVETKNSGEGGSARLVTRGQVGDGSVEREFGRSERRAGVEGGMWGRLASSRDGEMNPTEFGPHGF